MEGRGGIRQPGRPTLAYNSSRYHSAKSQSSSGENIQKNILFTTSVVTNSFGKM